MQSEFTGNNVRSSINDIAYPAIFFIVTILTRLPFTSRLLYHWDSVQFALGLEDYDITVHQPHPPGYFLYVMLGRLVYFFIRDANYALIIINIFFSGFTVVTIYFLGKEIFGKKAGVFAAVIAITSPNLWFHGEVALTYIVESFFSSLIALLCWRILRGRHGYLWLSVIALGISGGIRQNTMVFLLPLWLYSVKKLPIRKFILSIGLLGIVCLLWFVPMIWMTGGWNTYISALRELWQFHAGRASVFEQGYAAFILFSSILVRFIAYSIGAGVFTLVMAAYLLIRHKNTGIMDRSTAFFFLLWIMPSVLFFLLIFIEPSNPGYVLIFIPALILLIPASVIHVSNDLNLLTAKDFSYVISMVIIITNIAVFCFHNEMSCREIRSHDRNLSVLFDGIKKFSTSNTAVFVEPYIFYGYRQIMYYLPEYRVYLVDARVSPSGERRKTFWGLKRKTFISDIVTLSGDVNNFVIPSFSDKRDKVTRRESVSVTRLSFGMFIAAGSVDFVRKVFPQLEIIKEGELAGLTE
ncbi:MAG TPA: DUF2723 domain-containing protein [Desulfobacteraceae bacterium]|nr:DUF2723 domain-containing protein [Desulfobacteraceae bacterium]HPJ68709.1 DUF2723 domain-containing protein [Desulfobacteraceae bacterium]HPQ29001.1 DUF2723 domain-containing protein [Desulfobacteraceae bacterium]